MGLQGQCQSADIFLCAAQVVPGFRVAGFGQAGQGVNADLLDQLVFPHPSHDFSFQIGVLVVQEIAGPLEFELAAHAGQDDGGANGLRDVVDRAAVEAVFLILGGIHGRDEDDRDAACFLVCLEFVEDGIAIHVRHHHIEQDHIGPRCRAGHHQRARAGIGHPHLINRAQQIADDHQVFGLVVDHQHGGAIGHELRHAHLPRTGRLAQRAQPSLLYQGG